MRDKQPPPRSAHQHVVAADLVVFWKEDCTLALTPSGESGAIVYRKNRLFGHPVATCVETLRLHGFVVEVL